MTTSGAIESKLPAPMSDAGGPVSACPAGLPAEALARAEARQRDDGSEGGPLPVSSQPPLPSELRVLIVDDTPAIHDDFRKILQSRTAPELNQLETLLFGQESEPGSRRLLHVDSAYQGQEALARVEQALASKQPYSLAFVDIRMPPGWDGIETIERLWRLDPDLQIVICTAYADYSWEDLTRRLGHTENLVILKKPFDNIEVLQLAHTLVEKWRLTRISRERLDLLGDAVSLRTFELMSANSALRQEIAERKIAVDRLAAFSGLAQSLSTASTTTDAARLIFQVADQLVGWDACICELFDPEKDISVTVFAMDLLDGRRAECSLNQTRPGPLTPLSRRALKENGVLILRDPAHPAPSETLLSFGDTSRQSVSLMFVPMRTSQRASGLLSIQSYQPKAYNQASLDLFQALADYCGGALERIRSAEALRATQEQLRHVQKMEAIGQLAGGVAHDFNNLLAVIRGNAELALMDSVPPEAARDCLVQVTSAADRAANLTRQLLAFGRKQMMQCRPVLVNDVIGDLAKMLERLIGENIDLQCQFAAGVPQLYADPGMLEQALINLVINARDAMPQGGHLFISTDTLSFSEFDVAGNPEARPGAFVCIKVRDTGSGIAPDHLPHIFEPFFTTKPVGKGTGLGLATVYGILKQHQGWVEVVSQPGTGSAFSLFFPATPVPVSAGADRPHEPPPPSGSETILLVEDDDAVRTLTRRVLQKFGYQVCEASLARQALEVFDRRASEISLVLTDIVMPGEMNGRELAARLWDKQPALKVVFMSGYSPDTAGRDTSLFRRNGSCFLTKPCPSRTLLETIRRCLDSQPYS